MQMIVLSGSQLPAAGSSCDSNEKAAGSAYEQPGGESRRCFAFSVFLRNFPSVKFSIYLNPFLSFPRYIICNTEEARKPDRNQKKGGDRE